MKFLIVLQALSSTQAHSKHLRVYVQIEVLERGKLEDDFQYSLQGKMKANRKYWHVFINIPLSL